MTRFIFITGGVVSSLGKGIVAASMGALLQAHGYQVRIRKMDPYLNVDPGTMSPLQHGEVFVTEDGAETDLDLGHYERFTGVNATRDDAITAGSIYQTVIAQERAGDYLGATVQVIPHITDEIKRRIQHNTQDEDFVIVETGGTVGDIESLPFLEAMRQLYMERGAREIMFVHVTLLPWIDAAQELKTKPTQHSVRELLGLGISPHMLVCRTEHDLDTSIKNKISLFCNVPSHMIITAPNVANINTVPLRYHVEGMDEAVLRHFGIDYLPPNLNRWHNIQQDLLRCQQTHCKVKIGIVGKYVSLPDSYKSLTQALHHAALKNHQHLEIAWINSEQDADPLQQQLNECDGVLVPGGFGARGIPGKLQAIRYAREHQVPFLGICLGMQLAVIDVIRSAGCMSAGSSEFGACEPAVVDILPNAGDSMGATMRLGNRSAQLRDNSLISKIYDGNEIQERHRHRYEVIVTPRIRSMLDKQKCEISAVSTQEQLPEAMESLVHPWFVGVQFHPEYKSRCWQPHPVFVSFLAACMAPEKHT